MEEWVVKAHDLLIEYGFRRELLAPAVKHAHLAVREGLAQLMDLSAQAAIPLLLFSAGIADVIEEVCRQQLARPLPDTVHIVSNRMLFQKEDGVLTGFTEPVFHVFNKKTASVLDTSSYFHETDYEQRSNVLLVGDSLGDLHMSDGLEVEEILRVGFLNDRYVRVGGWVVLVGGWCWVRCRCFFFCGGWGRAWACSGLCVDAWLGGEWTWTRVEGAQA